MRDDSRWVRLMLRPRKEGRLLRASAPWVIGVALVAAAIVVAKLALSLLLLPAASLIAWWFAFVFMRPEAPPRTSADVTCDAEGVHRRGKLLAPRSQITQGVVVPIDGGDVGHCIVELKRKGLRAPLQLVAWNIREAREALRTLGLDASHAVADMWGASRWFALPAWGRSALAFGALFALTVLALAVERPLGSSVLAFAVALPFVRMVPSRIRVGADGVCVRWLGIRKFYSFSSIDDVRCYQSVDLGSVTSGVELRMIGGQCVRLAVSRQTWSEGAAPRLYERMIEALEVFRAAHRAPELSCLMRGGRSHRQWVGLLRAIGAGANVDMRTPLLHPDRLLAVVEDTTASPIERISAAIAISHVLPPADRRRIRIAAEASAAPGLRPALERACDPDRPEEELADLLATVEAAR